MSTPHPFLDNYKVEEEDEAYYEQSDSACWWRQQHPVSIV